MTHLTNEEFLKYVTVGDLSEDSLSIISKVNGHIRICPECKKKLVAFEKVNDILLNEAVKIRENKKLEPSQTEIEL